MTAADKAKITEKTLQLISAWADKSNNPVIQINSGLRPPARQALAMYTNLANGVRINYAAPGREVVAVFDNMKGQPKDKVLSAMTAKIEELAAQGRLVSRHCVTEAQYARNNIVDIQKSMPNPRDFVKAALKSTALTKAITPYSSTYNDSRVLLDNSEPAVHIEVAQ